MNTRQRNQQIGRIHGAAKQLGMTGEKYRQFLDTLTGCRSCSDMDDSQINHTLDWMYWLLGRRKIQPKSFRRSGQSTHVNLVRLCYAIRDYTPAGYHHPPMRSMSWQERTCGRSAAQYELLDEDELWRLIEGIKAIARRMGDLPSKRRNRRNLGSDSLPVGGHEQQPNIVRASA